MAEDEDADYNFKSGEKKGRSEKKKALIIFYFQYRI